MTAGGRVDRERREDGDPDDGGTVDPRRPEGALTAGPISAEERRRGARRIAGGFAAVVALSAGTTAYFSGGTLVESGIVAFAGLLVGVALVLFLGVR